MTDDVLTVDVGPAAHGGHCVARHDGQVVFVRHALPGERVRAVVTERRRAYLRADAIEVLTASADRTDPPCPYAGPGRCGGCDFQHVDLARQRLLKAEVLGELLVRLGGLSASEVAALAIEVAPLAGDGLGWRSRMQYAVDAAGRVGLRVHRSHQVVPIDRCLIAAPRVSDSEVLDRRWPHAEGVEVAASTTGQRSVLTRRRHQRRFQTESGPRWLRERAAGRDWTLAVNAFWQVHTAAPDTFTDIVLRLLEPREGERAWDLYGGVGLFAAALAERVGPSGRIVCVESDERAATAKNLTDLPQVRVVTDRVEWALGRRGLRSADIVVLDPPRAGAGRQVVRRIVSSAPRAVCYVSCDPAGLARDVATFRAAGWRLAALRAVDAYPMTHHVESFALLRPPPSR